MLYVLLHAWHSHPLIMHVIGNPGGLPGWLPNPGGLPIWR